MDGSSIIMDRSMITPWYCYLLQLLAGALVTNGIPHFVQGLSGAAFQSPFATPSGVGESSPQLNVYWGFANLAGGSVVLAKLAPPSAENYLGWACVGLGSLVMGTFAARHFGKVRARTVAS